MLQGEGCVRHHVACGLLFIPSVWNGAWFLKGCLINILDWFRLSENVRAERSREEKLLLAYLPATLRNGNDKLNSALLAFQPWRPKLLRKVWLVCFGDASLNEDQKGPLMCNFICLSKTEEPLWCITAGNRQDGNFLCLALQRSHMQLKQWFFIQSSSGVKFIQHCEIQFRYP